MQKIDILDIGECIRKALETQKRNILFVSPTLQYNRALEWFENHTEYKVYRCTPHSVYENKNGFLMETEGCYAIETRMLNALNDRQAVLFSHAFGDECIEDFEGFLDILKGRFYVNKLPDGVRVKHSVEKLGLFVAFTTPPENGCFSLAEKHYGLFDEVYLLNR